MKNEKSFSEDELLGKLMRYCAYKERCVKEVTEKLKSLNATPQQEDKITEKLLADNFVNPERFANSYASDKFRLQNWGRMRIGRELKIREIPQALISKALSQIEDEEYLNTFQNLFDKRWNSLSETNFLQRKKKTLDFLLYRGYEYDLIMSRLNKFSRF